MTYTRGEYSIGVGTLPGFKKPCMFIGNKYCIHKVASFNGQDEADEFTMYLEHFFGLRSSPFEEETDE